MSTEDLMEYRVSQLEEWKKEFEKLCREDYEKIMELVGELATKLTVLTTKITMVAIFASVAVNAIAWGFDRKDKFTESDKAAYYDKRTSEATSVRELLAKIEELEKKVK